MAWPASCAAITTADSDRPLKCCGQQADGLVVGIVVVAELGLLDLDVAELHLVEEMAGELAAGAGEVGALGRVPVDDLAHPHLRQHRQGQDDRQNDQHRSHGGPPMMAGNLVGEWDERKVPKLACR